MGKSAYEWYLLVSDKTNQATYEAFKMVSEEGAKSWGMNNVKFGTWSDAFGCDIQSMQDSYATLLDTEYKRELIDIHGNPCKRDPLPNDFYNNGYRAWFVCIQKTNIGKRMVAGYTMTIRSPYRTEHAYKDFDGTEKHYREPDKYQGGLHVTDLSVDVHNRFIFPAFLCPTALFTTVLKHNPKVPDEAKVNCGFWVGPKKNLRIYKSVIDPCTPTKKYDGKDQEPLPVQLLHMVEMWPAYAEVATPATPMTRTKFSPYVVMYDGTAQQIKDTMTEIKQVRQKATEAA